MKKRAVGLDYVFVPMGRVFQYAFSGRIIDKNDTESLSVAPCPFEVIHYGPEEVAVCFYAVVNGAFVFDQVPGHIVYALRVMDFAVAVSGFAEERIYYSFSVGMCGLLLLWFCGGSAGAAEVVLQTECLVKME
jgi:hypothetical protein